MKPLGLYIIQPQVDARLMMRGLGLQHIQGGCVYTWPNPYPKRLRTELRGMLKPEAYLQAMHKMQKTLRPLALSSSGDPHRIAESYATNELLWGSELEALIALAFSEETFEWGSKFSLSP